MRVIISYGKKGIFHYPLGRKVNVTARHVEVTFLEGGREHLTAFQKVRVTAMRVED